MSDWYNIKFLESATNLSNVLKRSYGFNASTLVARDVTVAIQQGRLFFEQAETSPIQIRPLLVYYGVLSFARAVTMGTQNIDLTSIVKRHGISDGGAPAIIEELSLTVQKEGTFQQFNDAIAPLSRFNIGDYQKTNYVAHPFHKAAPLKGQTITLLDILSRFPDPQDAIDASRNLNPNYLKLDVRPAQLNRWDLRLDERVLIENRETLVALVTSLRARFPFLTNWRLQNVQIAYDRTMLIFDNQSEGMVDDLSEIELMRIDETTYKSSYDSLGVGTNYRDAMSIVPPLTGGYGGQFLKSAISPLHGVVLNEFSLLFLGSFLLSSLVRYRPELWQHALSRSNTIDFPADDHLLSTIERFIDSVLRAFPSFVVKALDSNWHH